MGRNSFPREFYIPAGAIKVADKQSDAVCYVKATVNLRTGKTQHQVVGFCGKRARPDFNYLYSAERGRDSAIVRYFEGRQQSLARKAERAADRRQASRLEVGTILTGSWGYDQTNVDAYQVVDLTGKCTVKIRKIGTTQTKQSCGMSAYVVPTPDQFVSDEILTKRVADGNRISMDHCRLSPWEGRPLYNSWYA